MKHRSLVDRLVGEDAVIFPASFSGAYAAYPNGDRRRRPVCWLDQDQFSSIRADGVLSPDGEGFRVNRTVIRRLKNSVTPETEHRRQHQILEETEGYVAPNSLRPVQVNRRLTPLRQLAKPRPGQKGQRLTSAEIEAGERFAKDYEFANMSSIATQDYQSVKSGSSAYQSSDLPTDRLDARHRVMTILSALGPSLDTVVTSVCVQEISIERMERVEKWASGTGFTILKLGLERLVLFYGTEAGRRSQR